MGIDLERFFDSAPPFLRRRKLAKLLLLVSPGSKIQRVKFNNGAELYADISDRFPLTYFLTQSYSTDFLKLAEAFLKNGGHYFDAGAHFGFCTFGLIPALKQKKVTFHLFEAGSAAIACLQRSAAAHPGENLIVNHCALSDRSGISRLMLQKNHLSASFIGTEGETVPNLKIDDYVELHHLHRIELMKMDIEGSEPAALRGGAKSLRAGIFKALYFEVSPLTLIRTETSVQNYLEQVSSHGFKLFYVRPEDLKNKTTGNHFLQLNINGSFFQARPVSRYPEGHQTDLLALHETSEVLKSL